MLIDRITRLVVGVTAVFTTLAFFVLVMSAGPWLTVKAVNCLAGYQALHFGVWEWLAIMWLMAMARSIAGRREVTEKASINVVNSSDVRMMR